MKTLALTFFLLTLAFPAWGAVAPDNSQFVFGNAVATVTISSFVVTGSNNSILCGTVSADTDDLGSGGVTFNAVPMDHVVSESPYPVVEIRAWSIAGISAGTYDIVYTVSDDGFLSMGCTSFSGVDPTTPAWHCSSCSKPLECRFYGTN